MSWLKKLTAGLAKSSGRLTQGIGAIFTKRRLDKAALEELEELLIAGDLGLGPAQNLTQRLAKDKFEREVSPDEVKRALAGYAAEILAPVAKPLTIDASRKPHVVLVVGVNGSGKTTTIGKFASHYVAEGLKVRLGAGDTFRAAAIEQLKIWGERAGVPVVSTAQGGDAAALAYRALEEARRQADDLLLIDTAGRLHNKRELMDELAKVVRVLKKIDETAPHDILLVLDATTGQNAISQVETFKDLVKVTGLILTKLDGSAKGGILLALAEKFGLPVHAIGVGESAEDLRPFDPQDFAQSLLGI